MTPIPGFTKQWQRHEWVARIRAHCRRTSVDRFPFPLKEAAETPESFSHVHRDILSFAGSGSPERGCGNGLGGQADRGHRAKSEAAWDNRILAEEGEFASTVGCYHPDVFKHLLHAAMQVALQRTLGVADLGRKGLVHQIWCPKHCCFLSK